MAACSDYLIVSLVLPWPFTPSVALTEQPEGGRVCGRMDRRAPLGARALGGGRGDCPRHPDAENMSARGADRPPRASGIDQ